jgi:hypothetical protein
MLLQRVACWLTLGSVALAFPKPSPVIVERQATTSTQVPDGACTNSARTRNCWSNGFSISTDFDAKSPPAGKTVTVRISQNCAYHVSNSLQYNLRIVNTTANPDGSIEKPAMLIDDGSGAGPRFPGPLIRATWGDTLVVNVKNELQHNGTGIHWHGLRQLNSCQHDGVPGITECPIAPGKTRQYVFKLTQFGTTWYHSHWSAQYGEGVVGTIIIVRNHRS